MLKMFCFVFMFALILTSDFCLRETIDLSGELNKVNILFVDC